MRRKFFVPADVVLLRTGAEVPSSAFDTICRAVETLLDQGHRGAVYELVGMARVPGHQPAGMSGAVLERIGLLQNGLLHQDTAAVVDAMFDAEGTSVVVAAVFA
ncbi:hypothetical protein ACWT_5660 [Actinoplanes sp. SE50]|nr:hypothetical protein ACPL_5790 [Actinoplanes sp. SE50/110]ATO85075.1 hypothetical protein ACWT_5660 [Actinoplanes sp. SE50]SLM02486.1 hypothetical protein ACSP50_5736 [Actinoplanes sp. SE50/110]